MPYRKATPEEHLAYMAQRKPSGYRKATPQETAQYEYDQKAWYEKAAMGADQSVTELGHGINDLVSGNFVSPQDKAELETLQGVEGGWKTAGQVGTEIASVMIPGGVIGKVATRGLPMASRALKARQVLATDAVATGAYEGLKQQGDIYDRATAAGKGVGLTLAMGKLMNKAVNPSTAADNLVEQGVKLTPGQKYGGVVGSLEESMSYIPGLAGGVKAARTRALESWNNLIRKGHPPHVAMEKARKEVSGEYDRIFKGTAQISPTLRASWGGVMKETAQLLPPKEAKQFMRHLGNLTATIEKGKGKMAGKTLQALDRGLGKLSTKAYRAGDQIQGDGYKMAREQLRQAMPENMAHDLAINNAEYAAYATLRDATAKAAPSKRHPEGLITPGELMSSAVKGNRSAASEGTAIMQDIAAQGAEVLGSGMPSSSGIQDAAASLTPALVAGAGIMAPAATLAAGVARTALLNKPMQGVLTSNAVEQAVRQISRGARVGAGQPDYEEHQRQMAAALRGQR